MKKILFLKLKYLARLVLKRYKPQIISITGSVGKTTTKEACEAVLKSHFKVRATYKNFNNEIGVPLTIIGIKEAPAKSIFSWLYIFLRAIKLIIIKDKKYPQILILEMGIDRPGDMDYLISIAPPDIAIVTGVSFSHLQFFKNIENIKEEKAKLIKALKKEKRAIINYDNTYSREMRDLSKAVTISYGLNKEADLHADDLIYNFERYTNEDISMEKIKGINFKLNWQGSTVPVKIPEATSFSAVYGALAAVSCAISLNLNLVQALEGLNNFKMPKARMNVISGIKNTYIIDDTYNSSPSSSLLALNLLQSIKFKDYRQVVVMGEMLELGSYTEEGHKEVGKKIAEINPAFLIVVGEKARDIIKGAQEGNFDKNKCFYFNNNLEAGKFLQEKIKENDLILVKGSQGVRMEKVVKEIMAQPLQAKDILIRQEKNWL
ncbi:UDP-N-acetylmuramoyl-tripeptide--D-alanyl-D-alanine ligase [Patescibacteria group bacterium]|nr:UDP-N-acetylmuramoyl-tripeptide--D-alanyl-D-alanine ligase [Patescibacteria group bacterium]